MKPLVTVLVPIYNGEKTLPTLLESLTKINYPPGRLEILIVDNNSNDRTSELLAKTSFRILFESQPGAGTARNTGIKAAKGEFIACTDGDCIVDPEWINQLLEGFVDPRVGAVAGTIQPYDLTHPIEWYEAIRLKSPGHCTNHYLFFPTACTANVMYRTRIFYEFGGFLNTWGGEETDLNWRMQQDGSYRIHFLKTGGLVYHRYRRDLGAFCQSQKVKARAQVYLHRRWNLHIPTGRKEIIRIMASCINFFPSILVNNWKRRSQFWQDPSTHLTHSLWEAWLDILVPWIRFQGIREAWQKKLV